LWISSHPVEFFHRHSQCALGFPQNVSHSAEGSVVPYAGKAGFVDVAHAKLGDRKLQRPAGIPFACDTKLAVTEAARVHSSIERDIRLMPGTVAGPEVGRHGRHAEPNAEVDRLPCALDHQGWDARICHRPDMLLHFRLGVAGNMQQIDALRMHIVGNRTNSGSWRPLSLMSTNCNATGIEGLASLSPGDS